MSDRFNAETQRDTETEAEAEREQRRNKATTNTWEGRHDKQDGEEKRKQEKRSRAKGSEAKRGALLLLHTTTVKRT